MCGCALFRIPSHSLHVRAVPGYTYFIRSLNAFLTPPALLTALQMNDIAKKLERQGAECNSILWVCRPFTYRSVEPSLEGGARKVARAPPPKNLVASKREIWLKLKLRRSAFSKEMGVLLSTYTVLNNGNTFLRRTGER